MSISSKHISHKYVDWLETSPLVRFSLRLLPTIKRQWRSQGELCKINGWVITSSCVHEVRTSSKIYFTAGSGAIDNLFFSREIPERLLQVFSIERVLMESEYGLYKD